MARRVFTVREHSRLPYERLGESVVRELEALTHLPTRALDFRRHELRTGSYVGLIQVGDTVIQIAPKVDLDDRESLVLLLTMLSVTGKIPVSSPDLAELTAAKDAPLLEVWIRSFAEQCRTLLRRRMRREYMEIEERTNFIRGKLLVGQTQSGREALQARYPCRFEEFTTDHLLNRLLRFCTRLLLRTTRLESTRSVLIEIEALLADVALTPIAIQEADTIRLNRLNQEYEPVVEFCRLLLRSASIDLRAGTVQQLALLFDMNHLFEAFVTRLLDRFRSQIEVAPGIGIRTVRSQGTIGRLFGEFQMKPDVLLTCSDDTRILLDAKYKALDDGRRHASLSQDDFYQMFGYARGGERPYDQIILLYPKTPAEVSREYQWEDVRLRVRQLDLARVVGMSEGRPLLTSEPLAEVFA